MITSIYDNEFKFRVQQLPNVSFYGVLLALLQLADTDNTAKLVRAFPDVARESMIRYHAPGGCVSVEEFGVIHKDEIDKFPAEAIKAKFAEAEEKADRWLAEVMTGSAVPGEGQVIEHTVFWGGNMAIMLTKTGVSLHSTGMGTFATILGVTPKDMTVMLKPEGL